MSDLPYTSSSFGLNMEAVEDSNRKNAGPHHLCTNCRQNPAYLANETVNSVQNREPWCPTCIERRFNEARDDERRYPFFRHQEVQTPSMGHYENLFDEDYIRDWSYKTNEWTTPVEKRVKCDCDAGDFIIGMVEEDPDEAFFLSCNECEKKWCMYCGDQKDPPYDTPHNAPSIHSTAANPNACKNTRAAKAQQRQAEVSGLTQGKDYQICPMCNRYCEESLDTRCEGCYTGFCFVCGLKQPGHAWVPGLTCTFWRPDQYHPR